MKYTLEDLQEEKVYIEITCDEDFNKLLPYTNIVKSGTNFKHEYPYEISFKINDEGWCKSWYSENNFKKGEIKDIILNKTITEKEEIKTKILTFTIDGNSTYNLEIKWEDWELLKQGNKLKLL